MKTCLSGILNQATTNNEIMILKFGKRANKLEINLNERKIRKTPKNEYEFLVKIKYQNKEFS